MEAKVLNKLEPNRNLWVYSGHDITIANLLSTWNLFNHKPPPYTSTILIELLRDESNQIGVSLFLKNETDKIYPLILPTCTEFCNLYQFKNILKDIILTKNQWENECQLDILTTFQWYQHNMSHNQNLVGKYFFASQKQKAIINFYFNFSDCWDLFYSNANWKLISIYFLQKIGTQTTLFKAGK